jgi:hypothetical protein
MLGGELALSNIGFLGIPKSVDSSGVTDGNLFDLRANVEGGQQDGVGEKVNTTLERLLEEVARLVGDQMDEADHFNNSRIADRTIIYELQPTAMKRQNFWQPRGAEIPKWFPGVFAVFPDTIFQRPEKSVLEMNHLLTHAWRTMAPKIRGG